MDGALVPGLPDCRWNWWTIGGGAQTTFGYGIEEEEVVEEALVDVVMI